MKPLRKTTGTCDPKVLLITSSFLLLIICSNAATVDWKGTTSSDWATGSNWSTGSVPGSADDVRIGVVSFSNQPTLGSGTVTTIASLTLGTASAVTLTINSGYTLSVTGSISQNPSTTSYGTFSNTITGQGSISCASLNVGNNSSFPPVLANNYLQLVSTVSGFHITGNVAINSTNYGVLFIGIGYNNASFSLEGGTTVIDGTILTANTSSGLIPTTFATPKFSIDIPSGSSLNPILQLNNASAINPSSVAGTIDFYNNTGGTGSSSVYYSGADQEVYTDNRSILNSSPQTYQNLQLTGSGTKTTDGGTLTVGGNLSTSSPTVSFSTNNTAVTVGGCWTNSSNVSQGSGNITIAGSLTNNSGGTLNLGSGNLYISGNYTNNTGGVYTQGSGTVVFNGTGAQALTDNSTTGTSFKKVNFSGGGTATMNSGSGGVNFSVAPSGILTMSNSSELVAGSSSAAYLMLKSDTTGTASVAAIPSGCDISGFVAVQRFVQGSPIYDNVKQRWLARNYRLMTSQVNEGADGSGNYPCSLNYLGASTIITDCTSTYASTGGNPSLYIYNEYYTPSNMSFTSGNFIGVTNITSTTASGTISTTDAVNPTAKIYTGEGYMMYFRGDKVTHITGSPSKTSYPYVAPESVTFTTSGYLNQGTYAVRSWNGVSGLMFTTSNYPNNAAVQGYNLIGNPYPSTIDWSTFSNTNSSAAIYGHNVDPTIYILNPTTNNYDSYNASTNITNGSAGKYIPSGQGFFVHANNSSPTLTFNENAKSSAQVTGSNLLMGTPVRMMAVQQLLRLKLVLDSLNYDEIVIGFNSSASPKYNNNEDSQFLAGPNAPEGLASFSSDSIPLAINCMPLPKLIPDTIRLDVEGRLNGNYILKKTELDSIPPIFDVWLMDNYQKDSLDLRHNSSYVFNVETNNSATYGRHRFSIIIRQNPALAIHLLNFTAAKTPGGAQLNWETENEKNYTYFTIERSINGGADFAAIGKKRSDGSGHYNFLDKNPVAGINIYRIRIEDLNRVVSYSDKINLVYDMQQTPEQAIAVYPNPASGIINLNINFPSGDTSAALISTGTGNTTFAVKIFNITGVIVKTAVVQTADWSGNVAALMPGTYIVQVVNNQTQQIVGKNTFIKL